jgi:hypothetical protein
MVENKAPWERPNMKETVLSSLELGFQTNKLKWNVDYAKGPSLKVTSFLFFISLLEMSSYFAKYSLFIKHDAIMPLPDFLTNISKLTLVDSLWT